MPAIGGSAEALGIIDEVVATFEELDGENHPRLGSALRLPT